MGHRRIGYCTNVHAGRDWDETFKNLQQHAVEVRQLFSPGDPMGIGLWLSANSARKLVEGDGVRAFADWLGEARLVPFTLNGFPYGDFHQPVVKHRVYEPTWWQPERREYTEQLVDILDQLLPQDEEGSISTLPIAWGRPMPSSENLAAAGRQLKQLAEYLERLEQERQRLIYVCLEPEPGCVFDTTRGAVDYFEQYLLDGRDADRVRRYIRLCHDVCHAAVMFEPQQEVFQQLSEAGILVGKIQVSAAVSARFSELDEMERAAALAELSEFNEPRYLHQTVILEEDGQEHFFEDLPDALASAKGQLPTGEWRVHFHVPIYLPSFGELHTTQHEIQAALAAASEQSGVSHFEVETYAWSVLPPELKQSSLAAGIAQEMRWFADEAARTE